MSVTGYFVKRPRAEIEADIAARIRDEYQPKKGLTPLEAARIIQRRLDDRRRASQPVYADMNNLDPVLRFHLRIDQ